MIWSSLLMDEVTKEEPLTSGVVCGTAMREA